ncbi:MAG TPA: N-acetyl-gamma-glutamyl-phosphate reductase, partial [Rhizobiaceae bacterium]|nr:N-acetyl-gamma-glutamyl-phosphate reductase [Rhizobiaceae bacterium]
MKPKIFIDGEHGTTGLQIRTRLADRPDLEILSIPEAERRNKDMRADFLNEADIAILCLPDDASREAVAILEGVNSTRIIDTSTAHRTAPGWTYGFAEMDRGQRERLADARLVANPGCYPTGAIALVRPLVKAGLLSADHPVSINAVSGYTGGGKQMIAQMEDPDHPDHIAAPHFLYGLPLQHKHVAEMKEHGMLSR